MSENKQKLTVKHTLAGLLISALSSALIAIGYNEYELALALLGFSVILAIFYGFKEFPYWFQKVMDVFVFYTQIKEIAKIVKEDSPKLDTSRGVINKSLEDIEKAMEEENPDLKFRGSKTS